MLRTCLHSSCVAHLPLIVQVPHTFVPFRFMAGGFMAGGVVVVIAGQFSTQKHFPCSLVVLPIFVAQDGSLNDVFEIVL